MTTLNVLIFYMVIVQKNYTWLVDKAPLQGTGAMCFLLQTSVAEQLYSLMLL